MLGTVDGSVIRQLVALGEAHGLAPASTSSTVASRSRPNAASGRVPARVLIGLWEHLAARLGPARAVVAFAEQTKLNALGPYGFTIQTAATLEQALDAAATYFPLVTDSGTWRWASTRTTYELVWDRAATDRGSQRANEAVLANFIQCTRELVGSRFQLERVCFQHPAPADARILQQYFDCELGFNARVNSFSVTRTRLDTGLAQSNASMHTFFRHTVERLLPTSRVAATIDVRVRSAILQRLSDGSATADAVAAEVGLSRRSLHRHLHARDTNFRDELARVRRDRARELVDAGAVTMTEIAYQLGFAHPSGFSRAYRAWFGEPPTRRRTGQPPV